MNIKEIIEIFNYRNLSGKSIRFDKTLNYIIGENNIGKTNILELLNSIFAVGKFVETDFYNALEPIKVVFTLEYDEASIGFFEDNFDIDKDNSITIVAEQDVVDGRISYYHRRVSQQCSRESSTTSVTKLFKSSKRKGA